MTTAIKATPLSLRLPKEVKKKLLLIAKNAKRSTSFIAQEAIQNYIELQDWKIEGVKKAMQDMDEGRKIDGDIAMEWMASLGTDNEILRPSSQKIK